MSRCLLGALALALALPACQPRQRMPHINPARSMESAGRNLEELRRQSRREARERDFSVSSRMEGAQRNIHELRRQARREVEQHREYLHSLKAALAGCSLEQRELYDPDVEEEYSLGRTVAARLLADLEVDPLPAEHPLSLYVSQVGQYVALVADAQGESATAPDRARRDERHLNDRPWPLAGYRFLVLPLAEPRATASPGGTVMISTGLLRQLQSEEELAAVLAHELSHLRRGHGVEVLKAYLCRSDAQERVAESARERVERVERNLQQNVNSLRRGQRVREIRSARRLSELMATATASALAALRDGYPEDFELEADRMAVAHLAAAGYNPSALRDLLLRMGREAQGRDEWFRTHPAFAERLATVTPRLEVLPPEQRRPAVEGVEARTRRFQRNMEALPPAAD